MKTSIFLSSTAVISLTLWLGLRFEADFTITQSSIITFFGTISLMVLPKLIKEYLNNSDEKKSQKELLDNYNKAFNNYHNDMTKLKKDMQAEIKESNKELRSDIHILNNRIENINQDIAIQQAGIFSNRANTSLKSKFADLPEISELPTIPKQKIQGNLSLKNKDEFKKGVIAQQNFVKSQILNEQQNRQHQSQSLANFYEDASQINDMNDDYSQDNPNFNNIHQQTGQQSQQTRPQNQAQPAYDINEAPEFNPDNAQMQKQQNMQNATSQSTGKNTATNQILSENDKAFNSQIIEPHINTQIKPVEKSEAALLAEKVKAEQMEKERQYRKLVEHRIKEALGRDHIDTLFQPIVRLPQRKIRFFDCSFNLRDNNNLIIQQKDYKKTAISSNLMPAIDNMALLKSSSLFRKMLINNHSIKLFFKFSYQTMEDNEILPKIIKFFDRDRELTEILVLEFEQSDYFKFSDFAKHNLKKLGELGVRFSLSSITDMDIDLASLFTNRFRFFKLDAKDLLEETGLKCSYHKADFNDLLERYGLQLVINNISNDKDLVELLDYNINLGQGILFGPPKLVNENNLPNLKSPNRDNSRGNLANQANILKTQKIA